MNQKRWSIIDLENQAKEHEEIANAFRRIIRSIKIVDSSYELEVERADKIKVRRTRKKLHWMQRPENRAKVMRNIRKMTKLSLKSRKNGDK